MAVSCKDWNLPNLRGATMIGSKIDSDCSLDFPFYTGIYIIIPLTAFVVRKLQKNHICLIGGHIFVKSGLFLGLFLLSTSIVITWLKNYLIVYDCWEHFRISPVVLMLNWIRIHWRLPRIQIRKIKTKIRTLYQCVIMRASLNCLTFSIIGLLVDVVQFLAWCRSCKQKNMMFLNLLERLNSLIVGFYIR